MAVNTRFHFKAMIEIINTPFEPISETMPCNYHFTVAQNDGWAAADRMSIKKKRDLFLLLSYHYFTIRHAHRSTLA